MDGGWAALGWPGLLGVLAWGAALVLDATLIDAGPPAESAAAVAPATRTAGAAATAGPVAPVAERIADLVERALAEGLEVRRTEQRPMVPVAGSSEGVVLVMPVRASYADLRRFVETALRADPALALQALRLQRAQRDEPLLEARLEWWLHENGGRR